MQFALKEWDHQAPAHKAGEKSKENSNGMALATISSKNPGAKAGGGDKKKHFGKRSKCWNCGEKGHKQDSCPNPKQEKDSSDGKKGTQQNTTLNKGRGLLSSNSNGSRSSSKNTDANATIDEDDIDGTWVALSKSKPVTGF